MEEKTSVLTNIQNMLSSLPRKQKTVEKQKRGKKIGKHEHMKGKNTKCQQIKKK